MVSQYSTIAQNCETGEGQSSKLWITFSFYADNSLSTGSKSDI